ncbi:MAG: hypothetical protein WHX52_05590 [Anaerolineae bacterium]
MDQEGVATATLWFTFVFLPLIPLRRYRVQFLPAQGAGYSYQVISEEKHSISEILKTYLLGWIVAPVLIFGPLFFAIRENWETFQLPETWYTPYVIFSIIWFIVVFSIISIRLENRYRPPKTVAAEPPTTTVEEPQEVTTPPEAQGKPWRGIAFILVLVGSVVTALYMVIAQVGPAVWLIRLQLRWLGGYYVLYTFLFVWVLLLIIAAIIGGLISSIIGAFKSLYQRIQSRHNKETL